MNAMTDLKPVRLLIAAMGGEGGGVLAGWLTEAALTAGLWVQRTSVPGVAQRTGATTYYLEFLPRTGDRRPVMGLHPTPGQVDVLVATELLEARRMVEAGFVTPDRTRLFASTHRTYTVDEKSAMTDGRLDDQAMIETCRAFARSATIRDLSDVARAADCHLNAVILGLLAGSGALGLPEDACRDAIHSGKRASEANMRGFEAGLALTKDLEDAPVLGTGSAPPAQTLTLPPATAQTDFLPGDAARLAAEGVRRLTDYQDADYAASYLSQLRQIAGHPAATPALLEALARHLALRMSYEDTHRVADLKLRQSRLVRVKGEAQARDGDIVDVTEYMKPGPEEIFGMFPEKTGRKLTALFERRGWIGKSLPMKVTTTRFSGFIRLKFLAYAKRWRLNSLRHADEMTWLDTWLGHIRAALDKAPDAAPEIVETARLVRGYGSTYKRGIRNWRLIESHMIAPCLNGTYPAGHLADAVLQARLAAVKDPDGTALDEVVEGFRKVVS